MSKVRSEERISPEFKLLLAASLPFMTDEEGKGLRTLCTPELNWQGLSTLILRHRMPGLVFTNINHYAQDIVPMAFSQAIQQRVEKNRQRELVLMAESIHLGKLFRADGTQALFLKGPLLSIQVYKELGLRHSKDVDVLIRLEELKNTIAMLGSHGYHVQAEDLAYLQQREKSFIRYYHHITLVGSQQRGPVELHWRMTDNPRYLPVEFERGAFERAGCVELAGENLATLSDVDNFLYLCAHGAIHGWFRLKWLCDIAAYLRSPQSLAWEHLSEKASEIGLERPVAQATYLAHSLLKAPLPPQLQELATRVNSLPRLAELAKYFVLKPEEKIFAKGGLNKAMIGLYQTKLRKELKYKAYALMQAWISREDCKIIQLPDSLFFLYILFSPFFWLLRKILLKRSSPTPQQQEKHVV